MTLLTPFINHFVEESIKRESYHILLDSDINKACHEISNYPISITPKALSCFSERFDYNNAYTLSVYPSKQDNVNEDYLLKAEQLVESMHGISNKAVFQIAGNKDSIECSFYGDEHDIDIIDSGASNFFSKSVTLKSEISKSVLNGSFYIYDFLPNSPFYKSLTTFQGFVVSPLNIIPKILRNIEDGIGVYQVIFKPLSGEMHSMVEEAIDSEWLTKQNINSSTVPSLQATAINRDIEYKSPEFKSYFAVSVRLILPCSLNELNDLNDLKDFKYLNNSTNLYESMVKSFISNYSYGQKAFSILGNSYYSNDQILNMVNDKSVYHSGFIVNSHELTSLLHIPYQIMDDKDFRDIFMIVPAGDKPLNTLDYEDIGIGKWACGNSDDVVNLPIQKEIPHVHVQGISRSGKSFLLGNIAIERFKRSEAVFVLDPHGDLVDNILRNVPKEKEHDVIVIDFGLQDYTPQITIRENVDNKNPSKVADDLSESMRDVSSGNEKFWGPKMSYYFSCLFFIYSSMTELNLINIRQLLSSSGKAKNLRSKVKAKITHPVIREFLDELEFMPYESIMPVVTRLSHLLLDTKSLRLFSLNENKISISDIMDTGKLCLVNLSIGKIGKQRSSILSGLIDSLINNNALSRANISYEKRKPCTVIKDEMYLCPGDLDSQLTGLAKYGLSVVFAHQYLDQVEFQTKEVMATAGTRIVFKVRRKDAEIMAKEFSIAPDEFTSLKKFQAFVKIEDEVVKVNTPKPVFNDEDHSDVIMQNCLDKYYVRHDKNTTDNSGNTKEVKKLEFDVI